MFSFFSLLLFSLPLLALDLHFFFSPPFLSSSNFFLPFPPAFLPFFLSTILFPFVFFLFYFLFPPFCCFSFSLSSLYFIFLISSSFSSPLSFSFFFSSLTQNEDFLWCNSVYSYDRFKLDFDRSNWILIYHFGRLCILPYPLHCIQRIQSLPNSFGFSV